MRERNMGRYGYLGNHRSDGTVSLYLREKRWEREENEELERNNVARVRFEQTHYRKPPKKHIPASRREKSILYAIKAAQGTATTKEPIPVFSASSQSDILTQE